VKSHKIIRNPGVKFILSARRCLALFRRLLDS